MLRNNVFGAAGSAEYYASTRDFAYKGSQGNGRNSDIGNSQGSPPIKQGRAAVIADERLNVLAKEMQHVFASELKMARENSLVGNYSLATQKYKRVIKMVEKYSANGCATENLERWR